MTDITPEALEALSKKATPGTWEVDSEYDNDALYSGGGGCGSGFKNYFIGADVGGTWKTLLDTVNSDHKLIEEDYDEGGKEAWDVIGRANAAFIVALVNAYRTGQLIHAVPSDILSPDAIRDCLVTTVLATPAQPSGDVVEAVARAIMVTNGACFVKDWTTERRDNPHVALAWDQATAAITAYEAASGVAKMREALEDLRATPYPPVEDPDDTLGSMLDNQAWIVLSHVASRIGQRDGIELMERWQDAWAEGEVQKGYFSPHRGVAAWIARHCQLTPEARAALGEKP